MKRTYLLPEKGNSYKANLHCHSTVSDGDYSVGQLREKYLAHGYSIVAFTDHDVLIDHSDLCDGNFLALNGYEMEVDEPGGKSTHICLIAKKQDNLTQVCYNKNMYVWGNARRSIPLLKYDRDDYIRVFSCEGVSDMIRRGREAGFFVTLNHPTWSLINYSDYSGYVGMDAIEIFNTGSERVGFNEYNCHAYDDLLRLGRRLYCIAADDNHNRMPEDSPLFDSFGGWTVIRCASLDYECVTSALSEGSFYASTGPEIHDLWTDEYDDGTLTVHITTSPAHRIQMLTGTRHCELVGANYGSSVTTADFRIDPSDRYFRLDVIDDYGRHANTNAQFI